MVVIVGSMVVIKEEVDTLNKQPLPITYAY
jgi:hypothetical protein